MTHRAFLPQPANDTAGTMGEHLFREAVAERVDLGDMRTVLRCLHEAGWSDADKAAYAEAAVEYARARVQRRNALRNNLAGSGTAIAFAIAATATATNVVDQARAAEMKGGPIPSDLAGLLMGLLPLGFVLAFGFYLRLTGRRIAAPEEDLTYGDTTLFGEGER